MTPEQFRSAGHQLIDWIADMRTETPNGRVLSVVQPGDVRRAFPGSLPPGLDEIAVLLAQLSEVVVPASTAVQHPRHFGWFPSNASLSSVLGDMASSGLGGLGISWESNPALTEVEEVMCDWMRQLTGLSDAWHGTIQDTASTACLVAMLSARERASGYSQGTGGLQNYAQPLVVYATDQAHSSVPKAVLLAGFGRDNLRMVSTNPVTYAMDPEALNRAMQQDVAAGRKPAAVIAAVGSTGVTAMDPIGAIVQTAAEFGAWVHVDAAMAGSALLLPEFRDRFEGIEGADSISWNPHKWMGTILDTSLYYVRDVQHLVRVMSTNPSFLRSTGTDAEATQYRDWGIPLGRRFRSLKLWFQLRLDGIESIQQRLRRDLANAAWFASQVRLEPDWRVVAPVPLQTVCIRHEPLSRTGQMLSDAQLDAHTLRWVRAVNTSGQAFCSPSVLDGKWMVRVSIGVEATERSDVSFLWELVRSEASKSAAKT